MEKKMKIYEISDGEELNRAEKLKAGPAAVKTAENVPDTEIYNTISPGRLRNLYRNGQLKTDDLCLITDNPDIASEMASFGICTVLRDTGGKTAGKIAAGAAAVITSRCPGDDPEDEWFSMVLDHYHKRPHLIAEDEKTGIRIRESTMEDFPFLSALVRECGPDVFPGADKIVSSPAAFQSYIEKAYALQGFGFWTVERETAESTDKRTSQMKKRKSAGAYEDNDACNAGGENGRFIGWAGFAPGKSETEDEMEATPGMKTGAGTGTETAAGSRVRLETGYAIRNGWRGCGIGTAAVRMCIRYAVKNLNADIIEAKIEAGNLPSRNLALSLGFTEKDGRIDCSRKLCPAEVINYQLTCQHFSGSA